MLGATEEFVVSITAEQGVVASPAIKRICAGTGERPVASCKISPQKVCTIAPGKAVTAGPSFDRVVAGPAGVPSISRLLSNSSLFVQTEKYECKSVETFRCGRSGLTPRMSPPRTPRFQPMRQESDTGTVSTRFKTTVS